MRKASFLDSGPRLSGIIKLCKVAKSDTNFTKLFADSEIKYKKSFLHYLDFCKDKNLIEKIGIIRINTGRKSPAYRTTEAGHQLLTILGENN